VRGFVIPRMKLGNLVMMPQPARAEMADDETEKKLFHDTKAPLNHSYLAGYLWIREQFAANAILHFGTHGSQEWTPGKELNAYATHLKGTSAAVFSRSSNLRGLLDMDHPFEYLGGISLAVQHLDGKAPQLYISNMRDPNKTKLETAEKFMAKELRAVYHHPNWVKEMQKEGYSGTLKMLDVVNNFWGWQTMDKNIVRNDQWQEFHETYVKDKYKQGTREWFEKSNPTALAQITERMIEAIRKDYWQADEQTKRELVEVYQEIAKQHDVQTSNEAFKTYVAELAQGYGISANADSAASQAAPQQAATVSVQGRQLQKQEQPKAAEPDWLRLLYLLPVLLSLFVGMLWQWLSFKTRTLVRQ